MDLYEVRKAKNRRPYTFLQFIVYCGIDHWQSKWHACETQQQENERKRKRKRPEGERFKQRDKAPWTKHRAKAL